MEAYLIAQPLSVIGKVEFEYGPEIPRRIDVKRRLASFHGEGREQTEEAEDVVSVDMGNAYGLDLHQRYFETEELVLDALAAVNKEEAPPYVEYLGALMSSDNGNGRSRPQYFQRETATHPSQACS